MSNLQKRKTGDTLLLSGELNEHTPIDAAEWVGATGAINIWRESDGVAVVDHGDAIITTDVTPKRYSYTGESIAAGMYQYEIEVEHATIGPRTYPNDGTKYRLKVLPQGA